MATLLQRSARSPFAVGPALSVALAAGVLLLACSRSDTSPAGAALTEGIVERRDLEVVVEASGTVEAVRLLEVKSRAGGEVLEVLAETGDEVESGDLLARIDPRDVENEYAQARADVDSARVRARIATDQLERNRRLLEEGVLAASAFDTSREAAATAEAARLRAETALRLAAEKRGDVTIRAPADGTVITRQVEPGQIIASATGNVSGGNTLFQMADLTRVRVRAKLDETDIGRVRPGQTVRLNVEAHAGAAFRGTVEKIEPLAVVEQNVTLFPILIQIDNQDRRLLPGMSAEITIEVDRRVDALAVPLAAVVGLRDVASAAAAVGVPVEDARAVLRSTPAAATAPGPGGSDAAAPPAGSRRGSLVFLLDADGKPVPRAVRLGLADWEHVEVLAGLVEGDRVVLVGVAQMQRQDEAFVERIRERAGSGPLGSAPGGRSGGGAARPPGGRP